MASRVLHLCAHRAVQNSRDPRVAEFFMQQRGNECAVIAVLHYLMYTKRVRPDQVCPSKDVCQKYDKVHGCSGGTPSSLLHKKLNVIFFFKFVVKLVFYDFLFRYVLV